MTVEEIKRKFRFNVFLFVACFLFFSFAFIPAINYCSPYLFPLLETKTLGIIVLGVIILLLVGGLLVPFYFGFKAAKYERKLQTKLNKGFKSMSVRDYF